MIRLPTIDERRKRHFLRFMFHLKDAWGYMKNDALVTLWSVVLAIGGLIVFVIYLKERMPR